MKYLYINEEGRVGLSDEHPTKTDLECIAAGILQVICVCSPDGTGFSVAAEDIDEHGLPFDLPKATLTTQEGEEFHIVE